MSILGLDQVLQLANQYQALADGGDGGDGGDGDRGDLYQFPFGRNNDEFGHSHVLPTQQMIISFCLPSNHHFCQDTASIVDYQRHHGVSLVYPHPMNVVVR